MNLSRMSLGELNKLYFQLGVEYLRRYWWFFLSIVLIGIVLQVISHRNTEKCLNRFEKKNGKSGLAEGGQMIVDKTPDQKGKYFAGLKVFSAFSLDGLYQGNWGKFVIGGYDDIIAQRDNKVYYFAAFANYHLKGNGWRGLSTEGTVYWYVSFRNKSDIDRLCEKAKALTPKLAKNGKEYRIFDELIKQA